MSNRYIQGVKKQYVNYFFEFFPFSSTQKGALHELKGRLIIFLNFLDCFVSNIESVFNVYIWYILIITPDIVQFSIWA